MKTLFVLALSLISAAAFADYEPAHCEPVGKAKGWITVHGLRSSSDGKEGNLGLDTLEAAEANGSKVKALTGSERALEVKAVLVGKPKLTKENYRTHKWTCGEDSDENEVDAVEAELELTFQNGKKLKQKFQCDLWEEKRCMDNSDR